MDGLLSLWREVEKSDGYEVGGLEYQPPFSPLRSGPKAALKPSRQKQIPSSKVSCWHDYGEKSGLVCDFSSFHYHLHELLIKIM